MSSNGKAFGLVKALRDRYEELAQVPIPLWGRIDVNNKSGSDSDGGGKQIVRIQSMWSSRAPLMKKALKTSRVNVLSFDRNAADAEFEEISTLTLPYAHTE
jgi:hypothetical protein